jgi:hypothetical protein
LIPFFITNPIFGLIPFNLLHSFSLEIDPYDTIELLISVSIGIFSILLLLLSVSAYRETRVKSILYAATAFGLFAVSLFVGSLEDFIEDFNPVLSSILISSITLAILILFFIAIVRRNK